MPPYTVMTTRLEIALLALAYVLIFGMLEWARRRERRRMPPVVFVEVSAEDFARFLAAAWAPAPQVRGARTLYFDYRETLIAYSSTETGTVRYFLDRAHAG